MRARTFYPAAVVVALALGLTAAACSSCSSAAGSKTVTIETAAIQSVHLVVSAEKTAYDAGAFGKDQHRKNLTVLKRILDHESALNDSLVVWQNSGQSVSPAIVTQTIADLQLILSDVQAVTVNPVANSGKQGLITALFNALAVMTPGGGGAEIDLTTK